MEIKDLRNVKLCLTVNGHNVFCAYFQPHMQPDGDVMRIDVSSVLKSRNGLVGFGPIYFTPTIMGVSSISEAVAAERWFKKKVGQKLYTKASVSVGLENLMFMLSTGRITMDRIALLANAGNLYALELIGVDVNPKIEEIRAVLKGNAKAHTERMQSTDQLMDILSEIHLARLATDANLEVRFGTSPDLTIGGIPTEVKRLNWVPGSTVSRRKIEDLQSAAIKQNAKFLAIETIEIYPVLSRKKGIQAFINLFGLTKKKIAKGSMQTMLFNHDIWTGNVCTRMHI